MTPNGSTTVRQRLWPLVRPLARAAFRWRRAMTMGVRGVVLDREGRILLVEHTYLAGWHLPGGGVERGESVREALDHEMAEEGGVRVLTAKLIDVALQPDFAGDHVALFRIDPADWEPCQPGAPGEILRLGWFAPVALPPAATAATRQRIVQALSGG